MNKLVYISGPYKGETQLIVEANIYKARNAAIWCAEHKIFYFCPHLNSANFDIWAPEVPAEFYYGMDIRIAWTCDALLLLPGWENSEGARREHYFFTAANRRLFEFPSDCNKLIQWSEENK